MLIGGRRTRVAFRIPDLALRSRLAAHRRVRGAPGLSGRTEAMDGRRMPDYLLRHVSFHRAAAGGQPSVGTEFQYRGEPR